MRRPLMLSGILVCLSISLQSQSLSPQVVATSGKSYSSPAGQIDFTMGELVTSSLQSGSNFLTQGFHQPEILFTSIQSADNEFAFHLYPNPTQQFVTVETPQDLEMRIRVHNALGQTVFESSLFTQNITIDLQSLVSGNYIMVITNASDRPLFSYILFKH